MSRISGFFSGDSNPQAGLFAKAMARLMTAATPASYHLRQGAMAATGTGEPAIAQHVGCIAVVDGSFYDAPEFSVNGPAAQLITLYRRFGFPEALKRINGDFAVALFDQESGTLWLG